MYKSTAHTQLYHSLSPRPVLMVAGLNAFHTIVSQMLVAMNREILRQENITQNSMQDSNVNGTSFTNTLSNHHDAF